MGIHGLLQFIKEAAEPTHVKKYKGQVVAVDTYCWLHKGAYACAEKLAKGEPTDQYVVFCLKLVDMLLSFGIKPVLVFDGCTLPSKKEVEKARREKRQANLLKGKQLLREGKLSEARDCFGRSVNVTHAMAHEVIKAARAQGVDCVVAPYEADAQLAYLNKTGIVQAIITEDSDLLAFGCKKVIKKIGQYLKMNITVSEEYIEGFIRANNTFLYQLVFDPVKRKLVPLNAYDDSIDPETLLYAGRHIGDDTAFQIALGNKDIHTMEQIDDYNPEASQPSRPRSRGWNDRAGSQKPYCVNSIWSRDYKPGHNTDITTCTTRLLEKSTTKGIEKIISIKGLKLPSKELLVKRSRSEEMSDGDLLSQYSFSKAKKPKKENSEDGEPQKCLSAVSSIHASGDSFSKESSNTQPKVRNKFASFLQRKNEESGAIVVPGTRSRFFCHATAMVDCTTKNETAQPSQDVKLDCQAQETKSITEDPVPQCSETGKFTRTVSSSPVETQRSCFSWSGSLGESPGTPSPSPGVLLLQQFHRQRNSQRVSQGCEISRLHTVSNAGGDESDEESSPLLEMECSSQSQGSSELSESSLDFSRISQVSNKDSEAEESDSRLKPGDDPSSQSSAPFSTVCTERKHTLLRSKVPGLQRSNFVRSHVVTKLKPLMPAKVSGLSKKLLSAEKKNHHNAENKPGLQVTIRDLWKNFQFRRDSEKLPSCKKSSDPLSPIKDNIQLTPETEEEIFNQLEYSHVQRAIFQ
ncbi:exonuclease 1 isoform X3 [Caretta caretta]|uniref:exonuclease 1 isoform X3 n=1 Tax=Caretta caretta TaxID=8467 RepID=UPI00209540A2|nr:exonuclease 1 isoform X3 [Caretta caretta]